MEVERRSYPLSEVEIRSTSEGKISFRGLAATYGTWSKDLGGFVERVTPTAFTRAIQDGQDVPLLVNHDQNLFLGRTGTGTVRLTSTDHGLLVEADSLPDTQAARDLKALGGEVRSMSFGFRVPQGGDEWNWKASPAERALKDVDLRDVSVLTGATPAYNETTAEIRSLVEEHRKDYSTKQRKQLAKKGHAMPDGSYPIVDVADLKNAIQAYGRASDPAAVKAWIKKRAKALGASDQLPDDWRSLRAVGDNAGDVVWDSEDGYADWQSDVQASLSDVFPGSYPWVSDISMDGAKALVCCYTGGESKTWVVPLTVVDGDPQAAGFSEWVEVEQQYVAAAAARDLRRAIDELERRAGAVLSSKSKQRVTDAMQAMRDAHSHLETLMNEAGDSPMHATENDVDGVIEDQASLDARLAAARAREEQLFRMLNSPYAVPADMETETADTASATT